MASATLMTFLLLLFLAAGHTRVGGEEIRDIIIRLTKDITALGEALGKDYNELKGKYEHVKTENDNMKVELANMKENENNMNKTLHEVEQRSSTQASFCDFVLAEKPCGNCLCVDDHRAEQKHYCDCQHLTPKQSCQQHLTSGNKRSGIYRLVTTGGNKMQVFCDQDTEGGGWMVIQRRNDASTNFYRDWEAYKKGFGEPHWNLWIGLDNIRKLGTNQLRVDMKHWNGKLCYAKYKTFHLDDEKHGFAFHSSGFSGNCGDGLVYHNGLPFSTYDHSKATSKTWAECPKTVGGAWWYGKCYQSNLNGEYLVKDQAMPAKWHGIIWVHWAEDNTLRYVDMKIRWIWGDFLTKFVNTFM